MNLKSGGIGVEASSQTLARIAAVLFFLVLVLADAVIGFFVLRDTVYTMKFPHQLYFPVISHDKDANPNPIPYPIDTPTPTPGPPPTVTPTPMPAVVDLKITVQPGDTLSGLSVKYDVSMDDLAAANKISDRHWLSVGQELLIPGIKVTPKP
jgi:hypothetical protein